MSVVLACSLLDVEGCWAVMSEMERGRPWAACIDPMMDRITWRWEEVVGHSSNLWDMVSRVVGQC